jgi:hypothetical protein
MKLAAKRFLVVIIVIMLGGLLVIAWLTHNLSASMPTADRVQYLKLYADWAKAILVGFGAALLAVLIPAYLSEARFHFERLKDSRTAYSEAKTGQDYLLLRLSTQDLKDAAALVQRVHVRKHEAELYPELAIHLKRRRIDRTPEQWGDELYGRLFIVRQLLESKAGEWDSMSIGSRLALLREALPAPGLDELAEGSFGFDHWADLKPADRLPKLTEILGQGKGAAWHHGHRSNSGKQSS